MSLNVHPDEIVARSSHPLLGKHDSWDRIRVGDFAEIKNGFAFDSGRFNNRGDGVPLIRIRDVGAKPSGTFYDGEFEDEYWVERGDLVIGMDGDFRIARWKGPRSLLNQRVCRVRVLKPLDYDDRFLEYVLPGYLDAIHEQTSSVTVKHLSSKTIAQIPVPRPSINEQQRIVEVIEQQYSRLDTGVESLQRASYNLTLLRNAILRSAIEGRLVYQVSATTERLRQRLRTPSAPPAGSLIPDRWRWIRLPDLGIVGRGRSRHRPRNDRQLYGGPYPFIQTGDIANSNGQIKSHAQTYSAEGLAQSRLWPERTVCITIAANIAESAVLTYPACFPDSVVGVIADESLIIPEYLEIFIRTARGRLAEFAPATAQKNINLAILGRVMVPVPPIEEQDRIVKEVDRQFSIIDAMAKTIDASLQRASKLRQSILSQAFSGRLTRGSTRFKFFAG